MQNYNYYLCITTFHAHNDNSLFHLYASVMEHSYEDTVEHTSDERPNVFRIITYDYYNTKECNSGFEFIKVWSGKCWLYWTCSAGPV